MQEQAQSKEGQRERERETLADSVLSAEPGMGLDLGILRSGPELKPRVRHLTDFATQPPSKLSTSHTERSFLRMERKSR